MDKKLYAPDIIKLKGVRKFSMVTAYDYTSALLVSMSDIDIILVGDSLGMVMLGHENTLNVTVDEMLIFLKAVKKGAPNKMIVADMPFLSYQIDIKDAIENAGKLIKAGADAVKIEGFEFPIPEITKRLSSMGIPVMSHLGLTPQHVLKFGGFKVQGNTKEDADKIIGASKELEEQGAFCVLLEAVPEEISEMVTKELQIPTIGIGAGRFVDGQVLVWQDLLGINPNRVPKFVRKYANIKDIIIDSLNRYHLDILNSTFPSYEEAHHLKRV
ncbi:3-methyl-2-oxobutanoatehydroxymethyltransferase [Thermodesulfobium narugense DSM 14796]|uniref:3-methyl-2-oxobutanoate hydroxymethyltransferase n=1 Tax=Thermodesulfobium narugense DSM 14796 TaxID=747365 RepID=M1E8E9_9BACT|nr:3-methyl-2-oxobutanoate hydroxymethyltransferase [Thermodesulfobium narugense]AEE14900.1 3-methyl-2-oxobutanoatehydroxymethyltransferase [Thermodesulfobium narugense DSM 14796]